MLTAAQNIMTRLARADRVHQQEAGGRFVLRTVKFLFAFVLIVFVLDVVLHLSSAWRLGLLLSTLGLIVLISAGAGYLAFVRRNRLEHIARFLETRDPALGSGLINMLQLQAQAHDETLSPLTRRLAGQAVETYAGDLSSTPLEGLAWTGELRRELRHAAWAFLAFAALLAVSFPVTAVEIPRFLDPFGDHPPYSFTRLEIVEPGLTGTSVPYGKGIVVKVRAAGHQPREIFLTSHPPGHPEQAVTIPMFDKDELGYDQLVDNIRTELIVYAHTRNRKTLSRQAHIGVVLTPKLDRAFAQITPPLYTGMKVEEKAYAFKPIQALEGSDLQFRFQSNRPLREGVIQLICGERAPSRFPMLKSADKEVSGSLVTFDSGRLHFDLVDEAGLPSQDKWEGALTVTHDLSPDISITEPENDSLVAMDFKPQVRIQARDDYGLRTIRVHRGVNGVYFAPRTVTYDGIVRAGSETEDLNIADLGLRAGDVVTVFAEAIDNAPQPHLSRSRVLRLQVISVEDYNNFLREQTDIADLEDKYNALMDDLQELIEEQKKLSEAAQKLKDEATTTNSESRENLAAQLDQLLAQQNELNRKLEEQAARMENFVRENPLYDVERDLQKVLRKQAEEIRQSTAENDMATSDIARRSSPTTGTREMSADMPDEFKEASDAQAARLGGVQKETAEQVSQTLQDMSRMQELQKDFNLFEALYKAQQEIAAQAQAYNRAGQLSREDLLALKELAASEKEVADQLGRLEQKLRDDAAAAEELFPKAARSGLHLADSIKNHRLQPLAEQATEQMLAGEGERSYNLAERLRAEMEKLFSECQGGNCPSSSELDSYLALQRLMNPGRNFAQMGAGRNYGRGFGIGEGFMGTSGYAVPGAAQVNVLGNEPARSRGSATAQSAPVGKGVGAVAGKPSTGEPGNADVLKGLNPENRRSDAVASESVPEEYSDLVDKYFKAITTKKGQ